jgi:hypothetical protein
MANKVLLKKSSVIGKIPLATDLDYGEIALNYADEKLYFKNTSDQIKSLGGGGGTTPTYTKQLNFVGPVNIGTGTLRWYPDTSINITSVFISAGTPPSGGPLTLVIKKSDSTIATVSLSAGQNISLTTTLNTIVLTTDYITVDVTATNYTFDAILSFTYTRN